MAAMFTRMLGCLISVSAINAVLRCLLKGAKKCQHRVYRLSGLGTSAQYSVYVTFSHKI